MDFETNYMGLTLKNPLVVSSSPLTKEFDNFKKLEDAGVSAIVCHSIFEEQITQEIRELNQNLLNGTESYPEALSYFPVQEEYHTGPDEYLDMIGRAKSQLEIPVIASLNGHTFGGWIDYAKKIEQAGADGLELNIYFLASKVDTTPDEVEKNYLEIVKNVKSSIGIPVAVKVSPYFSAIANMAKQLDQAGADALVLFNRFYQPDINIEKLEVEPKVLLSTPYDLRLPLRWIGILYSHINASLAGTSGIHTAEDMIKVIMAGADVGMMCAAFLKNGAGHAETVLKGMSEWMDSHEYGSISMMKGVMSQEKVAHPEAFERANYMKMLHSY